VADFRPATRVEYKIKKSDDQPDPTITLARNPDILAELVENRKPKQTIVGFAAETGDERGSVLDHARAKLKRKGCDLLVVNAVGDGRAFEVEDNAGWLLAADGTERPIPLGSKSHLAATVWDAVADFIKH
jgi:phosphopantothenoylcysteine decarboxylase/phosphopantothenate--cysteine ligase